MKKTILIVGFACLSIVAVAQSNTDRKQASKTSSATAPRDAATGKATGRVAAGDVNGDGVADATAAKNSAHATEQLEVSNKSHSTDKSPHDAATGKANVRVATGDVNGDGMADKAAPKKSDNATGQTSGKRMHTPVAITK